MTLCHFLGAKLMHFVSKTSAFCFILLQKILCRYLFVSANSVLLLNRKQNNY